MTGASLRLSKDSIMSGRSVCAAALSHRASPYHGRSFTTSSARLSDHFKRSDFSGQGFTGYYDPSQPTTGPLGDASSYGAPRITPRALKDHLDQFVVGQDRAKKTMSVAVYNHYMRVQELERREDEARALSAQRERQNQAGRHPVEGKCIVSAKTASATDLQALDEFPGQSATVNLYPGPLQPERSPRIGNVPLVDQTPLSIEKSNLLVLGPSGTGKTLMAKTLARILEVPFSMSDCTPFTQAGYIGEDVEVCIQRLLSAADYDVASAESGIIVLDELDKIATARVSHGKDVSGEGVQQAMLKIIEGTTVQVQAKSERGSSHPSGAPYTGSPLSGGTQSQPNKGETYTVNTENILFICCGAFVGLHKIVMDRLAKGSIGFGARVQRSSISGGKATSTMDQNDPTIPAGMPENDELFRRHSPFFEAEQQPMTATNSSGVPLAEATPPRHNTLELVTPSDLHKFGMIPELTGRLPITTSVRPLTVEQLIRVLTEPRHALVSQYIALLHMSAIELRFSTAALHGIASAARDMGTGARGLRTVMERVLGDTMFEAPGSGVRFVLVDAKAARNEARVSMWGRDERSAFLARVQQEEDDWEREMRGPNTAPASSHGTFERYREQATMAA